MMNNLIKRLINDEEESGDFFTPAKVRLAAFVLCIIAFGIGLFFENWFTLLKGLILGYAIAVLLFRQHELSIKRLLERENQERRGRTGYFIRMLIRGLAIYIAVRNPGVSIYGCVCGLLSVPYGIYAIGFLDSFLQRKKEKGGKE